MYPAPVRNLIPCFWWNSSVLYSVSLAWLISFYLGEWKKCKMSEKCWENLWEFSLKPKQVEVWILKKTSPKPPKQQAKAPKLSLLLLISVLQLKFYSDLIFWNDWDFWAELFLVCFNSIPNNYIKFRILRLSTKKSFSSEISFKGI